VNRLSQIIVVVVIGWTLSFSPAIFAQSSAPFGLADEAEPIMPSREQVIANPAMTPAMTPAMRMDQAIATLREFQAAVLNNDTEYLLSILVEPEKSKVESIIAKSGPLHYVNLGEPITRWQLRCAACWDDEDAGEVCAVTDRRYIPSKHNNVYYSNLYLLKKSAGTSYISEKLLTHKKKGRKLKKRMKKNNRVCDFDQYTLELATPQQTNAAKNLLNGIGAVIGAIQK